jgi:hypothetical protein
VTEECRYEILDCLYVVLGRILTKRVVDSVRVLCHWLDPTTNHGARVSTVLHPGPLPTTSRVLGSPSGESPKNSSGFQVATRV